MALDHSLATELLASADDARRQTRSVLSTNWFPLTLFGTLALTSVPVEEFWSPTAMEALWLFGAPLAVLATGLWYRGREIEIGVSANPWPYVVTAAAIIVGCTALGTAGRGGRISYAGPLFVIGLGYLVFARLDRSPAGAIFGGAMAAAAIVAFALQPPHMYVVTMLPFGTGALLLGLWNLMRSKRAG
jgi:hypothetical protein